MRYEEKAKAHLARELGDEFLPGPWLVFKNEERERYCQPDGLWIDPVRGRITIIEIKYAHCLDAYIQLRQLYEPVLRAAFAEAPWEFRFVEMVRWYDPSVDFPGECNLRPRLEFAEANEVAIHIWKPRRGGR